MNILSTGAQHKTSALLQMIAPPARLEILLAIGAGEACVCHLETALGQRQAYISQHLMALREAGLIRSRREGRFVFYHLADPRLLELISTAAQLAGTTPEDFALAGSHESLPGCTCPHCSPLPVSPLIRLDLPG